MFRHLDFKLRFFLPNLILYHRFIFFLKTFSKTVTAILASVKAREDGKLGKPGQPPASMARPGTMGHHPPGVGGQGRPGAGGMMPGTANSGMLSQPRQLPNYNR